MAKNDPIKTQLRIPPELHEQLQRAIANSGRSMNAEIVVRLERSFPPPPDVAAFKEKIAAYDELSVRTRYAQMMVSEAQSRLAYTEPGTPEHDEAAKQLLVCQQRHDFVAGQLAFIQRGIESLIDDVKPTP